MNPLYWQSLVQGIVEGITEFLPISSTGHMILVNIFLKMEESFSKTFDVVIQLGAILAVVIYYRKTLLPARADDTGKFEVPVFYWLKLLLAVIPALFFGFMFHDFITEKLYNPLVVSIALIVGGLVLILADAETKDSATIESAEEVPWIKSFMIGLSQCIALVPGVSRSAASIIGGMCVGCTRSAAAEFSFALAIPTMAAATGYKLLKDGLHLTGPEWIAIAIGFVTSFFVAWGVIALLMMFIRNHSFKAFGYYRILVGAAMLVLIYVMKMKLEMN